MCVSVEGGWNTWISVLECMFLSITARISIDSALYTRNDWPERFHYTRIRICGKLMVMKVSLTLNWPSILKSVFLMCVKGFVLVPVGSGNRSKNWKKKKKSQQNMRCLNCCHFIIYSYVLTQWELPADWSKWVFRYILNQSGNVLKKIVSYASFWGSVIKALL